MKPIEILLVEDSEPKRKAVLSVLEDGEAYAPSTTSVTSADCTITAKRHLAERQFDLLILDLHLPVRPPPSKADPVGGLELLYEITNAENLKRPREVIVLTEFGTIAHSDIHLEEFGCAVIRYRAGDVRWKTAVRSKVKYIGSLLGESDDASFQRAYQSDFAVITALNHPEWTYVRNNGWAWETERKRGDYREYCVASLPGKDGPTTKVVGLAINEMGMVAACAGIHSLIEHYRPRVVIMAGIAGGVAADVRLGDLVVTDLNWNYDAGKISGNKVTANFEPEVRQIGIAPVIRGFLEPILTGEEFRARLAARVPKELADVQLTVHVGPTASGSAVVRSKGVKKRIRDINRKTLALDMEVYGVFYGCISATQPRPSFFAAKAICDHADLAKDDSYRERAACISGLILTELIETYGQRLLAAMENETAV